jgi:hypothetical protein
MAGSDSSNAPVAGRKITPDDEALERDNSAYGEFDPDDNDQGEDQESSTKSQADGQSQNKAKQPIVLRKKDPYGRPIHSTIKDLDGTWFTSILPNNLFGTVCSPFPKDSKDYIQTMPIL